MIDSLFDKGTMKKFDDLAYKQAKLDDKKNVLVKKTMEKMDSETLVKVLNVVKKYGHPKEKIISQKIEEKYFTGEGLEINDLINLDSLYCLITKSFRKRMLLMNNTIYILRRKSMDSIEEMLIKYFRLELCLKNKT